MVEGGGAACKGFSLLKVRKSLLGWGWGGQDAMPEPAFPIPHARLCPNAPPSYFPPERAFPCCCCVVLCLLELEELNIELLNICKGKTFQKSSRGGNILLGKAMYATRKGLTAG